jgi:RND family efflux transporter MFP subunit
MQSLERRTLARHVQFYNSSVDSSRHPAIATAYRAGVITLATIVASANCGRGETPETATANPALSVAVHVVKPDTIRNVFSNSGMVVPAAAADWMIAAPEPARIAELPKAEGAAVAVGDLLVRFDIPTLSAELASRQVDQVDAATKLEAVKAEAAKVSALFDQGVVPRNQVDAARDRVAQAESALRRAKADLDAATLAQDRAVVRARFAGVIAHVFHKEGDLVQGSSTDPVLRVIDPTRVQISLVMPSNQLGRATPGMPANVIVTPGAPPEPATIVLRNTPDPGAPSAEIRLSFVNATTATVDTPVQVEILLEQRTDAIVIPRAALVYDRDRPHVFIAGTDNRAQRREVRVGLVVQDRAEILSGVAVGDRVIVTGLTDLTDGALVSPDR